MLINKDTTLFGSFSKNPGNKGTEFFNKAFKRYKINALYKSYYIENIREALQAARVLKFGGFAIAMPYKKEVVPLLDLVEEEASRIGNVNTVVNHEGNLVGYNTDYLAFCKLFPILKNEAIVVAGNGGLASSVSFYLNRNNIKFETIVRSNWNNLHEITNQTVINCTPVDLSSFGIINLVDLNVGHEYGDLLHKYQAAEQFKLYTGLTYDA